MGSSARGEGGLSNLRVTCCWLIISDQWLLAVRTCGGNFNLKSVYEVRYILHVLSSFIKKFLQTPPTPPFCTSIEKSTLHWRLIRWCRQLRRKKRECLLRNRHSSILPSLPNCHSHGRVDLQDFKIQFQQLRMWESKDDNIGSNNYIEKGKDNKKNLHLLLNSGLFK